MEHISASRSVNGDEVSRNRDRVTEMSDLRTYPPDASEWGFEELESERARMLERAPFFDEIVRKVRHAFKTSITNGSAHAYDHRDRDRRATIQFWVTPDLYDEFFNSRTGYRAQFWRSSEHGVNANALLGLRASAQ
jgi:hypothetical protein